MRKVAVIAAAGWKAGGDDELCPPGTQKFLRPLEGCPNSLLPIGRGETIISRLAGQLSSLGFEVWAGVGRVGCLYKIWPASAEKAGYLRDTVSHETFALGGKVSPWTKKRVAYVASFARVVQVDDPDAHNCFHTYWQVIQKIKPGWDRLLLMHGDTLVRKEILEKIQGLPAPHIYVLQRKMDIFWLSPDSMRLFKKVIGKVLNIPIAPGNQVVYYMKRGAVPVIEHGRLDDWLDVDNPRKIPGTPYERASHEYALEWVENERRRGA